MNTIELRVEGMSCNHCVQSIQKALAALSAEAKVDLISKTVTISYDPDFANENDFSLAIEDLGYDIIKH